MLILVLIDAFSQNKISSHNPQNNNLSIFNLFIYFIYIELANNTGENPLYFDGNKDSV